MILKKLTLTGFKSFCDKTEFEFGEGVTCIVGPNGCGKSNIVDAVKWVLGEQSAKSLRGNQMQDMIFNGSSTRRSSGMAQVDLLFDNLDHTLDMENGEVTISRRLYRSGESEYLLNQQPCRLKDVRELFLDTGVGVDAYSVIEQGRVDILLQSNPAERRTIFEEAAGISKYKARRKETERKLERAWQNLLRVSDIIEELEKQLRSVKLQAGKARRFQEYDLRLRELRAAHALVEYHRLSEAHATCVAHIATSSDQTAGIRAQLSRQEMEQSNLAARALELDRAVDESNQTATELHSRSTALTERVQSAQRHRDEHSGILGGLEERGKQEAARLEEVKAILARERDKLPQLLADQRQHAQTLEQLNRNDAELAGEIVTIQATLEDEQSGLLDLLRQSSELHNKITQLDVHRESLSTQKNRLQARGGEVRKRMEEALHLKAEAAARLENIDRLIEEQQQRLRQKSSAAAQMRKAREQTAHDLSELAAQRSGLFSRQELLQDLEQRMEGVDRPIRELLQRKSADPENPRFKAIHGLVADVITTESRHAPIIEAALEHWTQYLVVDDTAAFLALNGDIEALQGRLHVLCIDRLSPIVDGRDFSETDGYVCTAIELVESPEHLEYLTRSLLGRTIVVESFEHALALAHESIQGYEFVTLKGDVVDSRGRLSIGPRSERAGLISRKSVLRQLSEDVVAVDTRQNQLREQLAKQEAELEHFEEVIGGLTEAVSSCLSDRSEVQARLQVTQEEVARLTREQPLIAGEVEMIEREIATAMEHATAKKESLGELEKLNDHRQSETDSCQKRIAEITAKRADQSQAMTQARVAAGRLAEKITAQQQAIYGIESSQASITEALEDQQRQIADCSRRIAETTQTIEHATEQLQDLSAQLARHQAETLRLRHERESLRAATEELSENAKSSRARLSEAEGQLHSEQMKLQEIVVRRDDLQVRVRDELGIELTSAYETYDYEQSWDTVSAEIDELRQKISRLGNINLDAIEEQTHLEGRLDFLVGQRKDLEDSRRQMQDLIDRLNRESRDRFASCFEEIRAHFQQMFRKLFGGGKADLVLDPTCEDVLEAGIEILVRPPGKELQSISLLSGGEKALTAIALLLSIFKTKPSPFVILDEVDAALDEANNERFNRIVTEFLRDSQFIIITHSKLTMHIASHLYGVTMQEPGVSRRVSVRFEDHTTQESPESAVA